MKVLLEDILKRSSSISDIELPQDIIYCAQKIGNRCYMQKGVYTVAITLLYYKVLNPLQDIRLHQSSMENGFSGRSFDTKYITPELARLGLPAMAESGWLTRSLEQPYPYDFSYNGKISGGLKDPFLTIVDYAQKKPVDAENVLRVIFNSVKQQLSSNIVVIEPLKNPETLTINKIITVLDNHFNYKYGTHNGAKLPVLALYAIYECLISEIGRYKDCRLAPLGSITACDLTSKTSGDIEIFREKNLFEGIEIKLDKYIDVNIVRVAREKIYKHNPVRYYILSYYGVNVEDIKEIEKMVSDIRDEHGCQLIINGLLQTIEYYLRLLSSLDDFVNLYGELINNDGELNRVHKEVWKDMVEVQLNK